MPLLHQAALQGLLTVPCTSESQLAGPCLMLTRAYALLSLPEDSAL